TGPTAAAYTLYFRGLRGAPAGTAALIALLEPLTATLLAALLLGDRLSLPGMAGAALLLAAVAATALRGSPVTAGPRRRSWRRTSPRSAGSSPRPPRSAARR
ncbi:MAG: EamA family transporter, partial [Trebonia sp.]